MYYYQRLKDIREDYDKNQTEIAEILKMQQTQYSRYERGANEMPMHLFIALAKYYNVSLDYLAGLINYKRPLYEDKKQTKNVVNIKNINNANFDIK